MARRRHRALIAVWYNLCDMTFDSIVMAAVADELNRRMLDGRVMEIHQPAPLDAVITIRTPGANHMLLISAEAESPRIHLTPSKRPNPKTPPTFCMTLRKHLKGARFAGAEQVDFDRILHLNFAAYDGERLMLIVEIMGKHSNVILMNGTGRILGAIKPVGKTKSRYRQVLPGRQYVPPPPQDKVNPLTVSEAQVTEMIADDSLTADDAASWLTKRFIGVSPFTARELVARCDGDIARLPGEFESLFTAVREREFQPVLITDDAGRSVGYYAFPSAQFADENQHERNSISAVAEMYYAGELPRHEFDEAKEQLLARLRKELAASESAVEAIRESLAECENAERLKQIGELILAQMSSIPSDAESVELADYYGEPGARVTVELDKQLNPAENAEAYFRKYHKAVSGAEALQDRLVEAETRLRLIEKTLVQAESIGSTEQIERLTGILAEQGVRAKKQDEAAERKATEFEGRRIQKVSADGWEILVGQNSEANDYLLTRVAKPTDIWVHVKASPSAHVIIRANGKPDAVPRSVLYAAAELAAKHSDSKHSSLVPVDYTLRKYVRKPKGAPAGKALYQNERTLYITP